MPGRSPGFGGRAPRSRQKTGGRERESGDFVDVVGFYPVREAGAGRSFGPDRWPTTLHVSRFNPRLTNQANNEKHGALLFSLERR